MKKSCTLLVILFLQSCQFGQSSFEVSKTSEEVRMKLKEVLPVLEKPNYDVILGRTPSQKELELGRLIFNDTILSRNNDVSCATCHLTNHGLADGNALNVGTLGQGGPTGDNVGEAFGEGVLSINRSTGEDGFGFVGPTFFFRNTLSTVNVAYRVNEATDNGLFHDGRFGRIHFQVLLPIHTNVEICGTNPIVLNEKGENVFAEGGPLFDKPVTINHSNSNDDYTGQDTGKFHAQPQVIKGIPYKRKDGSISIPNRNECLAIVVAKMRKIPYYQKTFQEVYGEEVSDLNIGRAISSFVMTHVALNSPYDKFVKGENSLDASQLRGLAMFMTPIGKEIEVGGKKLKGVGCINCHDTGTFGGNGFASLGVRSDSRSPLSRTDFSTNRNNGFFSRPRVQRGYLPNCHVIGSSALETTSYVPDIGRANGSFNSDDCFKFRIPPLRNVIETYPYFHHGTERALGRDESDFEKRSILALKNVVAYHLRGPINPQLYSAYDVQKPFFDDLYQKDFLVPYYAQNFIDYKLKGPNHVDLFPVVLDDEAINDVVNFIAYGLWDKSSMSKGALGNDVSHPKKVPSGLSPSITRDNGKQTELPPNGKY